MSKSAQIKNLSGKEEFKDLDINQLSEKSQLIYGDLTGKQIYSSAGSWQPKEGILFLSNDFIYFFGARSLLEEEILLKFKYINIKLLDSPSFSINFLNLKNDKDGTKYQFGVSWEDYISQNIKTLFIEKLNTGIKDNLLKKGLLFIQNEKTDEEAYFIYNRIINEKYADDEFLKKYIILLIKSAQNESSGYNKIYLGYLENYKSTLSGIYPEKKVFINNLFTELSGDLKDISRLDKILKDHIYLNDVTQPRIHISEVLKNEHIQKIIKSEKDKEISRIKSDLYEEYETKIKELTSKLEVEKSIYREIIKDNLVLPEKMNLKEPYCNELIDKITSFYYRYKILKDNLPLSFIIDKLRPAEGMEKFKFIIENLSKKYLHIIDPYLFSTEIEYLLDVPEYIEIKIISYAAMTQKDKLEKFKTKVDELRCNGRRKVTVRLIKYKQKPGTPLHDRAVFSKDWGISLSNSISQTGHKHDIVARKIIDFHKREEEEFTNYWYLQTDILKGNKAEKLTIIDI